MNENMVFISNQSLVMKHYMVLLSHKMEKIVFPRFIILKLLTLLFSRQSTEESNDNHYLDISSEGSSGSEENRLKEGSSSLESTSQVGHEGFANENGEVYPKPALPVFQYFEKDPPYGREPLTDKASDAYFNLHFKHSFKTRN